MSELRVGLAGLGRMGSPMARRLARAGLLTGVYNRTQEKTDAHAEELAVTAFVSPAELAAACNVLVTMVADEEAVLALYNDFLPMMSAGTVAIEMSTIGPRPLPTLAQALESRGASLVDAPVSGSVSLAGNGELTVMAGGNEADILRVRPVLEAVASRIFHVGPLGAGAILKLAVNTIVYALNEGLAEALVLAERAGINREVAYDVFAHSAIAAPFVHYRREEFESPGSVPVAFRLALAKKDLQLALELATSRGLPMPQTELDLNVLETAAAAGYADHDIAALAEYFRIAPELEGLPVP